MSRGTRYSDQVDVHKEFQRQEGVFRRICVQFDITPAEAVSIVKGEYP